MTPPKPAVNPAYPAAAKEAYDRRAEQEAAAKERAAPDQQHSDAQAAELEAFYAKLKPQAIAEARTFILARTPAEWQADMIDIIEADFPPPEPPPETTVLSDARDTEYEPPPKDD